VAAVSLAAALVCGAAACGRIRPAGVFTMGCVPGDAACEPDESPAHAVTLGAFALDRTEVTEAAYAACVAAGACTSPAATDRMGRPCPYDPPARAAYPVVCVTWAQAAACCAWAGKRLPSEAEWEKAARGPGERIYPRGQTADCAHANYLGCGAALAPVGSYPSGASPYGAVDLSGNVTEWVKDWYAPRPSATAPSAAA